MYGDNLVLKGDFAEYAVAPESALARKPAELTFAEASTIPQAGAGGGSGSFAIQLAKRRGAHVTPTPHAVV